MLVQQQCRIHPRVEIFSAIIIPPSHMVLWFFTINSMSRERLYEPQVACSSSLFCVILLFHCTEEYGMQIYFHNTKVLFIRVRKIHVQDVVVVLLFSLSFFLSTLS